MEVASFAGAITFEQDRAAKWPKPRHKGQSLSRRVLSFKKRRFRERPQQRRRLRGGPPTRSRSCRLTRPHLRRSALRGHRHEGRPNRGRASRSICLPRPKEFTVAKIFCVLYPDPITGYPPKYARDDIPAIKIYPNGQTVPSPQGQLGFKPGELVGCVSGALGLRPYLAANGHQLVVTSDKDGPDPSLKAVARLRMVISQPFWPAYLTSRANSEGKEAQAGRDRRNRLRPRRSQGCQHEHTSPLRRRLSRTASALPSMS